MLGETVLVLSPTTVADPYSGETEESWVTPTTRAVMTLAPPEPRPSDEPLLDARNSVTSGWTLYLPTGDPINSGNRVRVRGLDYPVVGEPGAWGAKGIVVQAFGTVG